MIVPRVRVQSRVPGFEKKSLMIIGFEANDLDMFKVHTMAKKVNMAYNFTNSGQNLPLPFCALQFGSLMTFLFGHSTTKLHCVQLILYTMPDFWRSESSSSFGRGKRLLMVCCGL